MDAEPPFEIENPAPLPAPDRWGALFEPECRLLVTALAGGVFLYAVNVYLATTILPSLVADIGGLNLYAWGTTLFVFASLIGSTSVAAILSRIDARRVYRLGAMTLIAGTVICALAPTMPVFLAGRFVQGFGGGLMYSLSFSMIRVVLRPSLWPRALGLLSAMFGIATILGPAAGGVAGQLHVWRVAFWVIVPVALFFAIQGARALPNQTERVGPSSVPWFSIATLGGSVLVIAAASISADTDVNLAGVVAAAVGISVWLLHERRSGGQLLPADTFSGHSRLPRLYLAMLVLVVASTVEVYVPYFGQHLQGLDVLLAGYLGAAMAAGWSAGSMTLSGAGRRQGLVLRIGPLICAVGVGLLVVAGPMRSSSAAVLVGVVGGLVLLGWGIGMVWPLLSTAVLGSASEESQETAGASISTIQLVATACGSALAGLLTNLEGLGHSATPAHVAHAARLLYLVFLFGPILGALLLAPRGRPRSRREHNDGVLGEVVDV